MEKRDVRNYVIHHTACHINETKTLGAMKSKTKFSIKQNISLHVTLHLEQTTISQPHTKLYLV